MAQATKAEQAHQAVRTCHFDHRTRIRGHCFRATDDSPSGGDAILVRDIYVADTDKQAWAEAGPEITRLTP